MSTPSNQEALRQELLEYAFDCHPNPEAIAARIANEPEVAQLFAEMQSTASFLTDAASAQAPPLDLAPPAENPAPRQARRPWTMRSSWIAAAAMIAVALLIGFVNYTLRARDVEQVKTSKVRLLVSAPAAVPDGTPLRFHVETHNLAKQPMAAQVSWQVLDKDGTVLKSADDTCEGSADYTTEGKLQQPRTLVVTARLPASGFEQTVRQEIRPTEAAPLVHITSDKPAYRLGETVHLRFACLDRLTLKGIDQKGINARLLDPQGNEIATDVLRVGAGVATWSYTVRPNAPGGNYTVEVRTADRKVPYESLKFLVRNFQPPKLQQKVELDRQSYAPGETGLATLSVNRIGAGAAAGATCDASLTIDGETTWKQTSTLDADGTAAFQFEIPAVVPKGAARFVTRVRYGGIVETSLKPFVVPTGKVQATIFPEGGHLLLGATNRVYVQVHDLLDRPLAGVGEIVDDQGTVCAPFETAHMGRGRVEFTPRAGRSYRLRLSIPNTAEFPLPKARSQGVALRARRDALPATAETATFDVHASGRGPWLATVFCRGVLVGQQSILAKGPSAVSVAMAKEASGVLRFTVFDHQMQPVAERLFHREASQRLNIALKMDHQRLTPGQQQKIKVRTTDENGEPVAGIVGITVTDRAVGDMVEYVRTGLMDHQQLWSDAKKPDEKSEEFFAPDERHRRNVDLLLGCMGWRLFAWNNKAEATPAMVAAAGDWAKSQPAREGRSWSPRVSDTLGQQGRELSAAEARAETAWTRLGEAAVLCLLGALLLLAIQGVTLAWPRLPGSFKPVVATAVAGCAGLLLWVCVQPTFLQTAGEMAVLSSPQPTEMSAGRLFLSKQIPFEDSGAFEAEIEEEEEEAQNEDWAYFERTATLGADPRYLNGYALLHDSFGFMSGGGGGGGQSAWFRASGGFFESLDGLGWNSTLFDYRYGNQSGYAVNHLLTQTSKLYPNLLGNTPPLLSGRIVNVAGDVLTLSLSNTPEPLTTGVKLNVFHVTNGPERAASLATLVGQENGRYLAKLQGAASLGVRVNDFVTTNPLASIPNLTPARKRVLQRVFNNPQLAGIAVRHQHQKGGGIRSDFAETLLWQPFLITDEKGEAEVSFDTSSSTTTWSVFADAHGEGRVGQAAEEFTTYLPFALDAKVPERVQEGDLLRIPISVVAEDKAAKSAQIELNLSGPLKLQGPATLSVRLKEGRGRAIAVVKIEKATARARGSITIRGTLDGLEDQLTRTFSVAPRGFPARRDWSGEAKTKQTLKLRLPDELARRTASLSLKFYPSPIATLEAAMQGMLREPHGCFEQVSSSNYPNVMILSLASQPAGDGADPVRTRALSLLAKGYQKLTGYEVQGGGFEWWGKNPAHAGLTAYGLLQFTDMARVFDGVDPEMVARTRAWLLGLRDGKGGFKTGKGRYGHFMGGSPEVRNAYISYALLYAGEPAKKLAMEVNKLAERSLTTTDAYELAVATCALAEAKHAAAAPARRRLATMAQEDGSLLGDGSITGSGERDRRTETTAFAVLAWLAGDEQKVPTQKALAFLLKQRQGSGQFGGTQATVMALKALSAYMNSSYEAVRPGDLTVRVNGKEFRRQLFGAEKQTISFGSLEGALQVGDNQVEIALTGGNAFPFAMELDYRAEQPESSKRCAVRIETWLGKEQIKEGEVTAVHAKIENTLDQPVANPMIWVGLPAGLHINAKVLDDLVKADTIAAWELREHTVVLYLRGLKAHEQQDIILDVSGRNPGTTRGAASRTYLYYAAREKHWAAPLAVTVHAP